MQYARRSHGTRQTVPRFNSIGFVWLFCNRKWLNFATLPSRARITAPQRGKRVADMRRRKCHLSANGGSAMDFSNSANFHFVYLTVLNFSIDMYIVLKIWNVINLYDSAMSFSAIRTFGHISKKSLWKHHRPMESARRVISPWRIINTLLYQVRGSK